MPAWRRILADDPDADFLLAGVRDGFRIVDRLPATVTAAPNHASATCSRMRSLVEAQISRELQLGHYRRCHEVGVDAPLIISPLGAISKTDGGVRLIHDASAPQGKSINDLVTSSRKLRFASISDVTRMVRRGWFCSKIDLRHAYRSVHLHPSCYAVTGICWHFEGDEQPTVLVDTRLPFGASASVGIFHRLTQAVRRFVSGQLADSRKQQVTAYLDDFCVVAETQELCQAAHDLLVELLQELGFVINEEKTQGPANSVTFLGVRIDTESGQMSLPPAKMAETVRLLRDCLAERWLTKRTLQRVLGKLNWACQVIRQASVFLRALIDIANETSGRARVDGELRAPTAVETARSSGGCRDRRLRHRWRHCAACGRRGQRIPLF
jgi:hypothetical protein